MSEADRKHVEIVLSAIGQEQTAARTIIAIAGAPASGKSTLAAEVVRKLNAQESGTACLVPMDGFHLHNEILDKRGLRPRKGAPETFDVYGLIACLERLRKHDEEVYVPVFDREADIAIAGARHVPIDCPIIVVEGNYLLLNQEPWSKLRNLFDQTIYLDVDTTLLEQRLVQRWLDNGFEHKAAYDRALSNDIPNALITKTKSAPADITLT